MRRNAIHALLGNGLFAVTQLAMLIALTNLTSPSIVGAYTLALATTAPLYLFANLRLRQMAITDTKGEFSYADYFTGRTAATFLVWIGIGVGSFALPHEPNWVLFLVSTQKALENVSDIFYAAPHKRSHLAPISRSLVVRGTSACIGYIWALASGQTLEVALAAVCIVYALGLVWDRHLARTYEVVRFSLDRAKQVTLARISIPLGLALATSSLNAVLPRYVLQFAEGPASVGLFSTAAYVLTVGSLVVSSAQQAVAPTLARTLHEHGTQATTRIFRKLQWLALCLSLFAFATALLIGKPFLTLVFGDEYGNAHLALVILCASTFAAYQAGFTGTLLNVYRRFEAPLPIMIITTVTTGIFAVPLVFEYGLEGAAMAVCAGSLVEWLLNTYFMRRGPRSPYPPEDTHP